LGREKCLLDKATAQKKEGEKRLPIQKEEGDKYPESIMWNSTCSEEKEEEKVLMGRRRPILGQTFTWELRECNIKRIEPLRKKR